MKTGTCLSVLVAFGFALSTAGAGQLNDTGQIACYDTTATSTGTVGGNPTPEPAGFEGQDCSFGASAADAMGVQLKVGAASVPGRDYTKIANDGSELPASAVQGPNPSDWACTRDNVTGLVWEVRTASGLRSIEHTYAWGGETPDTPSCAGSVAPCNASAYAAAISAQTLCGRSDWRLPTPVELSGLIAYQTSLAAPDPNFIDRTYFPDQDNSHAVNGFWTAATAANSLTYPGGTAAWSVDFANAALGENSKTGSLQLRLVSGMAAPESGRFTTSDANVAGQFTTVDAVTGLEWKTCPQGLSGADCLTGTASTANWSGALVAAAAESFAGHSDWRLPTITELGSIRDFASSDPVALDPIAFPNSDLSAQFWSSTSDPLGPDFGLLYRYRDTEAQSGVLKFSALQVRLVRGGNFLDAYAAGADTTPANFSIGPKSATAATLVESDAITVTGLGPDVPASLRVSGAAESALSINGGDWRTTAAAVRNTDTVRVRHRAAASAGATATTTLTIGGVSADFVSTASATPPGAPTGVVATPGNASATLTFNAPDSDGGSPITGYTAISNDAGGSSTCAPPPALSCTVTGLVNGQSYTFTVTASNSAGSGTPSAPSDPVTPATVPGAPTGVSATAQNGQATVSFTGPASNGGSPVLDYTATSVEEGQFGTCSTSPCSVTGLSNGTNYTFTVRARNAVGQGPASAPSNQVRPGAAPTISFEGTPRTEFPLNHNGFFFILLRNPDITLVVDDADSAPGSLTVEVASSNPGLLPAVPNDEFAGVHLFAGNPATPQKRPVTIRPAFNQAGSATLTFTVRDQDGLSSSVQVDLNINDGNRFPVATYGFDSIRLPAGAQAGLFEAPGFLTSASPGLGEELAQVVSHQFLVYTPTSSVDLTASVAPSIDPISGALRFTRASEGDQYAVFTWPTDSGAGDLSRCSGANKEWYLYGFLSSVSSALDGEPGSTPPPALVGPCGSPKTLSIVTNGSTATLLGVERSARRVALAKATTEAVGVDYTIRVKNTGAMPIEGVVISAPESRQLGRAPWTCSTTNGACVPASGQGAIRTTIDLDLDEEAVIVIAASLSDATTHVAITPTVTFAQGVEGTVFGNGVERIDAVSNDFISVGSFEGSDL